MSVLLIGYEIKNAIIIDDVAYMKDRQLQPWMLSIAIEYGSMKCIEYFIETKYIQSGRN